MHISKLTLKEYGVINVYNNEIKMKVINAMQRWKDRWKNYTVEEDIMNILNDAKLAVFNSYQSPSSNSSVL